MKILHVMLIISVALLTGCERGPESPKGFSLPKGDVDNGRAAFLALNCNLCHSVGDIAQVEAMDENIPSVQLGGKSRKIITYGDLVTSVINPSHRIIKSYPEEMVMEDGESKMPIYNDLMTVSQLVDLVTYLETHYELKLYVPSTYPVMF